jgi:3-oxoadipate enol-lactonase
MIHFTVLIMPERYFHPAKFFFTESGAGLPLVLVHGFPLDGRMWKAQAAGLSHAHRVIVPDLPGFGRSPETGPFTIDSLADDLHAFLADWGLLPCTLAGLSMGGYISLAFALRHPQSLLGLILVDTRAEADTADGKSNRGKMIELVRSSGSHAIVDLMFPKLVAPSTPADRPEVAAAVREMMEACPPKTIELALAAMRDRPDRTSELPNIPVPALIIVGEQDAITPPSVAQAMHDAMPRSVLEIIPDAGHMAPMEQPEAVTDVIARWLGR